MSPKLPTHPLSSLGSTSSSSLDADYLYDFIIVGGGTAGCVLASRLSLLVGSPKVLLLDRGEAHRGWTAGVPLLSTAWQMDEDKSLSIPTVPQPGLDGRTCSLVGGKILGGTTTFNSSIYTRGLPAEFDDWATRLDLPSWSYDALLPLFKRSQAHTRQPLLFEPSTGTPSSEGFSGVAGPWRTTSPPRVTYASATAFVNATKTFGIPLVQSLNDPVASATAVAVHEITGEYGRRTNVFEDFLMTEDRPGFGPGLKVGTSALVRRLEVDGTARCIGVWFGSDAKDAGAPLFARARYEVVLTAGAVFSPQILLLSGIGPKEDLALHGISCQIDLPGVGKGMSDHLGVYLPYSVPSSDSLDRLETSTLHAAGQVATFAKSRTGAFTFQGSQASIMMAAKNVPAVLATGSKNTLDAPLYANPRDVDEIPNLEILPMPYRFHSSMDDGKPDGLPRDLRKGKFDKSKGYFTPIVLLVRPKSTGVIKLKSSDPREMPECDPRFLSEASDVDILVHGMKLAKAVVRQMASDGYAVSPHGKNNPFFDEKGRELSVSDAELGAYARKWATNAYHMTSTLPISSASNPLGVLDEELRVRGIQGLRVADASVFPTGLSCHTQAAVVAVAERCADLLASNWVKESAA